MVPKAAAKRQQTLPSPFWIGKHLLQEKIVLKSLVRIQKSFIDKPKDRQGISKHIIYLLLSSILEQKGN